MPSTRAGCRWSSLRTTARRCARSGGPPGGA
ncbi:hypothetical protein RB2654_14375 [Rhodobacterales bacterium HTCC2654]|uniref:Uncharacterized protein n=1 Tax=Maritimibacter alkaliphilus HTCC2654 TaxID=314271 RepID=A3VGS4_9RHOB|nr:hypothetical protein RB2654_14375 [Rhodobacterales bacterium HTCC2654] [Maritimibacter alkaliphilus HTCC2654]